MPNKPKIEKDYDEYNAMIDSEAQEEIKKIREKIANLKKEVEKIGETLDSEVDKDISKE